MKNNFRKIIEDHASRLLFVDDQYNEIKYSDVIKVASAKEFSKTARQLVFCLLDNDVEALVGYLALLSSDAVPMVLNSTLPSKQLDYLVNLYQPFCVWLPTARVQELCKSKVIACYAKYSLVAINSIAGNINDSLALLLSTSGSTGSQKFVRLSRSNVISNSQSISEYLNLKPDAIPITTLPPSYTYGLSIIHSHILVGAKLAVTKKTFFDREFWDFLKNIQATSFGGVPYHYEILRKLRFTKMELPCLQTLTQAGGRMEPEITKEFASHCNEKGMKFFTMYGQVEATSRMSYLPAEKAVSKAGSIGVAIPGGEFCIQSADGQLIGENETQGELVYRGPNVSMGYAYGHEDLIKGDENCGVLKTGDVAKRDKDGYYYILGRLRRFIKIFGRSVNLQDVENYLLAKGFSVACGGRDDRLEVYSCDTTENQAIQIKKNVMSFLQIPPLAVTVYLIHEIPRSVAGKI